MGFQNINIKLGIKLYFRINLALNQRDIFLGTRCIAGMLLVIDFEKAFDSVSHKFLNKVLDFFKFGTSFKNWIKLFYENASTCVLVNGHCTDRFLIEQGCRQGDTLSPFLYVLVSEILGILLRYSNSLVGLNMNGRTLKLLQYADDTILTLNGTKQDLQCALEIYLFIYF